MKEIQEKIVRMSLVTEIVLMNIKTLFSIGFSGTVRVYKAMAASLYLKS